MEADPPTFDTPTVVSSPPADAGFARSSPEHTVGAAPADPPTTPERTLAALDLDAIGADLDGVEAALTRLGDGTYWTDEVTGAPLPDELLSASPTARHAPEP